MNKIQNTAVVLGAGGFLGRHICREFLDQGVCVMGVGRATPNSLPIAGFLSGDLLDLDLAAFFREVKPNWVINAAGSSSVSNSFVDPYGDWRLNVAVQARILEAIRQSKVSPFYIFLSSAAVYGEPTQLPITEEMPCRPISPYGMHKWQSELLQAEYARFYNIHGGVLRVFSAYGAGLNRQVVYELSQKIKQAENDLTVYGTGEETRDFIHAVDVARAVYHLAIHNECGIFNLASGRQTRISELAEMLVAKIRPGLSVVYTGQTKTGDPQKWQADISKLHKIGFYCTYSIEQVADE